MISDVTPLLGIQLPHPDNELADDVARIRAALSAIDGLIDEKSDKSEVDSALSAIGILIAEKSGKAEVDAALAELIDSAPDALNSIRELAEALGNDPEFAAHIAQQIIDILSALNGKLDKSGGTLSGALNEALTVTLASGATTDIGAAASNTVSISGTTTIVNFGTIAAGVRRFLLFEGALNINRHPTNMRLPGDATITTAAGDSAEFLSLGFGKWRCINYTRANGTALVVPVTKPLVLGAPATLAINTPYHLNAAGTYSLPVTAGLVAGDRITLTKAGALSPTVQVTGGVTITINSKSDTGFIFNLPAEVTVVWNGAGWEV